MLQDSLKLIYTYQDGGMQLYDLAQDTGEGSDLAAARPEKVRELRAELFRWLLDVNAQLPTPNLRVNYTGGWTRAAPPPRYVIGKSTKARSSSGSGSLTSAASTE